MTSTSHYTQVNDLRIHYLESGTPDPNTPPIFLLHGFPTSSHLYRNILPQLAHTHRVIALNLPASAHADNPLDVAYDYDFHADVLDGFLDALPTPASPSDCSFRNGARLLREHDSSTHSERACLQPLGRRTTIKRALRPFVDG